MRNWRENFIVKGKNSIKINPLETTIKTKLPVSGLFYRQQHATFTAETTLQYKPQTEKDLAGIVCYQSEAFNYVFGLTKKGKDYYMVLERTEKGASKIVASEKINPGKLFKLKVAAQGDDYMFSYTIDNNTYKNLGGTVSGDILSTDVAGGFTGSLIGLYATSGNDIKL